MTNLKLFHKSYFKYLIILLLLLKVGFAISQSNPVYQLIKQAEIKYKTSFSFNDDEVRQMGELQVELPPTKEAFLKLLQEKLHLNIIDSGTNNYVLVMPQPKEVIPQTLSGRLFDKRTSKPIVGAEINSGKGNSYTDSNGKFTLSIMPGDSVISIKHLVYGIQHLSIADIHDFNSIQITPQGRQLEEVTINYITTGISKLRDESYTLKPNEQGVVAGLVTPDIFESIQMIPGISNPEEDASSLHIRGGQPDQNLVLWNGIHIYQTGHLMGGISSINPYSVDKVNFYTKAINPAYGNHTSGAIELSSLTDYTTEGRHSAGINLYDADVTGKFHLGDKLEVNYSARHSINKAIESRSFNKLIDKLMENGSVNNAAVDREVEYEDYNVSVKYQPNDNNSLKVSGLYLSDIINYELLQGQQQELKTYDALDASNYGAGFEWNFKSNNSNNTLQYQLSNYDMSFTRILYEKEYEIEDDDPNPEIEYEEEQYLNKANEIIEQGITFIQKRDLTELTALQLGYQWNRKDIYYKLLSTENEHYNYSDNNEEDVESHALFANYQYNSKRHNFKLNAGTRINYYTYLNTWQVEPRLLVSYQLNPKFRLNSSYEKKSQGAVQTNETVSSSLDYGNQIWVASDGDNYPLLKSSQLTFGGNFTYKGLLVDMDFFRKSIRGLTSFNFGYTDIGDNDYHQGKSKIHGIDIYIKQSISKNLILNTSYSYNDAKNVFNGLNNGTRFTAHKNILHQLSASANLSFKNIKLAALYRWHTGIPYSKPTGIHTEATNKRLGYDKINTYTLPAYQRFDLSAKYLWHPQSKKFTIQLMASVLNVLDNENVLERIYRITSGSEEITFTDRTSFSPVTNVGIRVIF